MKLETKLQRLKEIDYLNLFTFLIPTDEDYILIYLNPNGAFTKQYTYKKTRASLKNIYKDLKKYNLNIIKLSINDFEKNKKDLGKLKATIKSFEYYLLPHIEIINNYLEKKELSEKLTKILEEKEKLTIRRKI